MDGFAFTILQVFINTYIQFNFRRPFFASLRKFQGIWLERNKISKSTENPLWVGRQRSDSLRGLINAWRYLPQQVCAWGGFQRNPWFLVVGSAMSPWISSFFVFLQIWGWLWTSSQRQRLFNNKINWRKLLCFPYIYIYIYLDRCTYVYV